MTDVIVQQVRRVNRVVTERVGALNDHFPGRERPPGEARLAWEIGREGCELRLLRARLVLDSRYLSEPTAALTVGYWRDWRRARGQAERGSRTSRPSAVLLEALSLYQSTGWVEVAAFNDAPFADHWLEKALT
jgi:hypothetical protein